MPKFKPGDRFALNGSSDLNGTIRAVMEVDLKDYYVIKMDCASVADMRLASLGDNNWTLIPKYNLGEIWRNKDLTEAFVVIENPYGEDDPYMDRLTSGRKHCYSPPDYWIGTYGPLIKWEPKNG